MASDKRKRRKLAEELELARAEHKKLLKRVEKARAKFEKRSRKLSGMEEEIARLEAQYYQPEAERMGQADAAQDGARPARLIYNPGSGGNTDTAVQLAEIIKTLRGHGVAAEVDVNTSGKSAREIAAEAAEQGEPLVIVAGDDNTLEEVARELTGSKTVLGILPLGTNNNLATTLGIPLDLDAASALIGMGVTRMLDGGEVMDGQGSREYFLESAGAGFGPLAESEQNKSLPHALRNFDVQPGRVEIELASGEIVTPVSHILTISNAPLMGQNSLITPYAKMDDGLLDVAVYEGMTENQVLAYFNRPADRKEDEAGVKFFQARRVSIQQADNGTAAGTDDKPRHIEVKVVPQALAAIVGNGPALSMPVTAAPAKTAEGKKDQPNTNSKGRSGLSLLGFFRNDDK